MAALEWLTSDGRSVIRDFQLSDEPLTLGRTADQLADLIDPKLSRQQCTAAVDSSGTVIIKVLGKKPSHLRAGGAEATRECHQGERIKLQCGDVLYLRRDEAGVLCYGFRAAAPRSTASAPMIQQAVAPSCDARPTSSSKTATSASIDLTADSPLPPARAAPSASALAAEARAEGSSDTVRPQPAAALPVTATGSVRPQQPLQLALSSPPPSNLQCESIAALGAALRPETLPRLCCREAALPKQHHGWDCGYANLGALLRTLARCHLMPAASATRAAAAADGIVAMQQLVEAAWREGFDGISAKQYRARGGLAHMTGTAGWIGAPEAWSLLTHLRVNAFLVEVVQRSGAGAAVFTVASEYFALALPGAATGGGGDGDGGGGGGGGGGTSGARSAVAAAAISRLSGHKRPLLDGGGSSDPAERAEPEQAAPLVTPPLYLQHDGHSRTLVGVVHHPPRLLIRDPKDALRRVRCVPLVELHGKQYQIIGVHSPALSDAQALARRGADPMPAAVFDKGGWQHDASLTPLRFDRAA